MKIAVLYQQKEPPMVDGIRKPMKKGGYSDSGADIAYCLNNNGIEVITSKDNPDLYNDLDWVFPDTENGIKTAMEKGADTFWLNTVLYKNHPIESFKGITIIGQRPSDVSFLDDKYYTNKLLREQNLPVIYEEIIENANDYKGDFPCVLKPIRGRGSQGVVLCQNKEELSKALKKELNEKIYGNKLMAEKFLKGNEITVSVFPDGYVLPVVERFNHHNGIAPYNGDVPVSENSRVVKVNDKAIEKITEECKKAVKALKLKGLVRIDCRMNEKGEYIIFDFNPKPNMTGNIRPHRKNQSCLTMLSAEAMGWSYFDLLNKMLEYKWVN